MAKHKGSKPEPENEKAAGLDVRRLSTSHPQFTDDLEYWIATDRGIALRLMRMVKETLRDPFTGIGKPEPLRGEQGVWSRRLTDEHRFLYRVIDNQVHLLQARFHYRQ